jgi:CHAD domain-containing protein
MSKPAAIAWDEVGGPAENARRHLPKLASDYFALGREVMAQKPDPTRLHSLRLATKRLRYTLELFRPCYGPGMMRCLAALRAVQQLLGEVNDVAAASRALGTLMNGDASQRDFVNKSLQPLFETRVAAFQKYWRELFDAPDQEAWWTYYLARHARHPKRKV